MFKVYFWRDVPIWLGVEGGGVNNDFRFMQPNLDGGSALYRTLGPPSAIQLRNIKH